MIQPCSVLVCGWLGMEVVAPSGVCEMKGSGGLLGVEVGGLGGLDRLGRGGAWSSERSAAGCAALARMVWVTWGPVGLLLEGVEKVVVRAVPPLTAVEMVGRGCWD